MSKTLIDNQIYNDNWFFELSPEAKLLFIYLITNDSCSLTGCYQIPLKVISTYTGLTSEKITKLFQEFNGRAVYKNGWVIIPNYIKHNPMRNPNIEKSLDKQISNTPQWVIEENERLTKGLGKGLVTLTKPSKEQEQEKEQEEGGVGETKKDFSSLKDITPSVIAELAREKHITPNDCQRVFIQMRDWLESKDKTYKNYKAGLRNWINRKIEEGKIGIVKEIKNNIPVIEPITQEQRNQNIERIKQLKETYGLRKPTQTS